MTNEIVRVFWGVGNNEDTVWNRCPPFVFSDSAFTERVLGAPAENFKGYVEADLTQRARLVPSNSLYLLHGLADLTAPYTHGVAFAKAMSEAGVIFRYQVSLKRLSHHNIDQTFLKQPFLY